MIVALPLTAENMCIRVFLYSSESMANASCHVVIGGVVCLLHGTAGFNSHCGQIIYSLFCQSAISKRWYT